MYRSDFQDGDNLIKGNTSDLDPNHTESRPELCTCADAVRSDFLSPVRKSGVVFMVFTPAQDPLELSGDGVQACGSLRTGDESGAEMRDPRVHRGFVQQGVDVFRGEFHCY